LRGKDQQFRGEKVLPGIVVRGAKASDAEVLKTLLDLSWKTHWGPHVNAASRARYAAERPAHGYVDACLNDFIIAERAGQVVRMYHLEGGYLHAINIAVSDIGTGIGSKLMQHAEARGARRLEVREFNTRARRFYAGRGWVEVEEADATEMGTPTRTIFMELPQT
jgi:ribosomal protein S18 acetylase RimI-like enzyme